MEEEFKEWFKANAHKFHRHPFFGVIRTKTQFLCPLAEWIKCEFNVSIENGRAPTFACSKMSEDFVSIVVAAADEKWPTVNSVKELKSFFEKCISIGEQK